MKATLQKTRVFWHETGHFIAGYYNEQHYGSFGTESITIQKVQVINDNFDYTGSHQPRKPKDYDPNSPIKHPAALAAALAYGCYLQCIYLGNPFNSCFNYEQPGVHGYHDYGKVGGIFYKFGMDNKDTCAVFDCIQDQFEQIKNNSEFNELLAIKIDDLIASDEPSFTIDPEELKNRFSSFLKKHDQVYKAFVEKLKSIFKPYMTS